MVDAGAVQLGALLYGPDEAADAPTGADPGSTVVILHGWADSAWSMDTVAQTLIAADPTRRLISLDMRGHGHSDRGPYNMVHLVGDVRGAFETLGLETTRPVVVGHSLGGQVLSQFAGLFPDMVGALISIEGIGPPPHHLAETDPDAYERMMMVRNVERSRQPVGRKPLSSLEDATERLCRSHPLLDRARAGFLAERNTVRDDDGVLWWRFDPASRDWLNGHSPDGAALRWRGITCPVLVVNGSDSFERYWQPRSMGDGDYRGPLAGESLEARLKNFVDVRYVEIEGGGHMLHYDKPTELGAEVLGFVDRL